MAPPSLAAANEPSAAPRRRAVRYESLGPARTLLVLIYVAVAVWYLAWRPTTFNPDAPVFSAIVYAAELFGFAVALMHIFMVWRLSARTAPPARNGLSVDVFVPSYDEPLELARVVHNLEHGGIFILYGDDVPDVTVDELRSFYEGHQTGTIMAPLPRLGDQFALGAWNSDGEGGNAYLAKCGTFDEAAVSDFFEAFQFRGPERFDPSQLQPGS